MQNAKLAQKFRTLADAMEEKISHLSRPMTQNPTPKRNKEYQSRLHEARNMERTQKALRALADGHEAGTLPAELAQLKTKDEAATLVRKWIDGSRGGYYSVVEADDYADTSSRARLLQGMIDGSSAQRVAREQERKYGTLMAEIALRKFPGYFPTPEALAAKVADLADIRHGQRVLEPSAGTGNLIRAVFEVCGGVEMQAVETSPKLAEALRYLPTMGEEGAVIEKDFLELQPFQLGKFDRIVMNPPFDKGADIKHIRHALNFLKPGGVLVAICANGPKQHQQLMPLVDEMDGTWETVPAGAFKESGTNVSAALLSVTLRDEVEAAAEADGFGIIPDLDEVCEEFGVIETPQLFQPSRPLIGVQLSLFGEDA